MLDTSASCEAQNSINCQPPTILSPIFYFNLVESIQDPVHFRPDVRIGHDVEKVEEILPVGGASVRGTALESILPCVETPPAELVGLQEVEVGVVDVDMLTCRIHGSETSSLVFFPVLVDPSLMRV